ncbi:glycoside hydrolase family protein [Citrobacter sp. Marseille-Q6884]|uniref:glycoside hydrolase family protein n=1 Tax=Citrobacter sp. Marseille-Q6884 TaxID=2956786 RepID=UPI0021B2BDB2|nr:lysozyme [Citrobacter sp. Marseille-Q6884]
MPRCPGHFTPACIAFIKQWQGLSLEKYQDQNGIWVIGYGHEITADENFDTPISLVQAEQLLLKDLCRYEAHLRAKLPHLQDRFQQEALIVWMLSAGITSIPASVTGSVNISQPERV